ncbi:MAG: tyrosinase family protein [Ginsengibacter sp.]
MKCRKNIRKLIQEYNNASAADKPNTALIKLKKAILDLKNPAIRPSLIADAQADGATSRYDDFVWAHHNVMMEGPNGVNGPNWAHRGPAFGPWHRELLKLYEQELQNVSGDSNMTLPFWNWTKDRTTADPGFPFFNDFLGPDGSANPNDKVTVGAFAQANGWNLNVDEENFGFLRRHFGIDGPGLPTAASVQAALNLATYDNNPWNILSNANSFRNTLEGWTGPRQIHNAVHRWVNGSMQPGTSPNDPVFFFHHCNIDRLYAVWQQKNASISQYLPDTSTPSASGLTRVNDKMATFGRTISDKFFGIDIAPADVVNHKAIVWYESDLPEIDAPGPTLTFSGIPQGLTTYKAVKFKVTTCRPVHFRITGTPTGKFGLTPMGSEFMATPDDASDFIYGYVWVKFDTTIAGSLNSSVDIEAYIIDEEGYYAPTEGTEFHLANYHVDLIGSIIPRASNSVALVVDRSGSMSDLAGGGKTKSQLLVDAIGVFSQLMLPNDEISISSFDNIVATPVPMQAVSTALALIAGADLSPRNTTWIGGGIQDGAAQLAIATKVNKSMLVLTDGNENVHPYVLELPSGTISNTTYAIGFGLPGSVSDPVLNEITSNTHGDLIITGNITTDEQRFNLTKYFVQILAGVTNMNVILDPQGSLLWGSQHIIPFILSETDVYVDLITLCPVPALLDFYLTTPSGKIIKAATAGPNIQFIAGKQVLFYRLVLPALATDPAGSHAGKWNAVLSLKDKDYVAKMLRNKEFVLAVNNANLAGYLPYSFVAHVYSNLSLIVYKHQESFAPGSLVTLFASLKEYDIPLRSNAGVWADITHPDKSSSELKLTPVSDGTFSGIFRTSIAGVYNCRVRAEGYTSNGNLFTREKTITAGVYSGNYDTTPPIEPDDQLCNFLQCLLSDNVISEKAIKRLKEEGIDIRTLAKCIKTHCMQHPKERIQPKSGKSTKQTGSAKEPDPNVTSVNIKTVVAAKPAKRPVHHKITPMKKNMEPTIIHMFTPPWENEEMKNIEDKTSAKPKKKQNKKK